LQLLKLRKHGEKKEEKAEKKRTEKLARQDEDRAQRLQVEEEM
jgi:hypothetical protein